MAIKNRFVVTDTSVTPIYNADNVTLENELPNEIMYLTFSPKSGISLTKRALVKLPTKIYGETNRVKDIIINTFKSRTDKTTGVLLSGIKGSGKTLLSNLICQSVGMPVIVISDLSNFDSVLAFLSDLVTPYVLFIDEYEKKLGTVDDRFDKENLQANFLSFLDGNNNSQKLVLLTVNSVHKVPSQLLDRPGRVFYHFRYYGVTDLEAQEFINDYMDEYYPNKKTKERVKRELINELEMMVHMQSLTFDALKAILEEVCRYPKDYLGDILMRLNVGIQDLDLNYKVTLVIDNNPLVISENGHFDILNDKRGSLYVNYKPFLDKGVLTGRLEYNDENFLYQKEGSFYFNIPASVAISDLRLIDTVNNNRDSIQNIITNNTDIKLIFTVLPKKGSSWKENSNIPNKNRGLF